MARTVRVQEAKTHLSAILAEVEQGVEVVIARGDTPIARLSPIGGSGPRDLGFVAYDVPPSFFDSLPVEELSVWRQ